MFLKFLFPFCGVVAGIFLSSELFSTFIFPAILAGISFLCWILVTFITKDPIKSMKYNFFHTLWIILLFASIGSIDFLFKTSNYIDQRFLNEETLISGIIKDIKTPTSGEVFDLRLANIEDTTGQKLRFRNINILVKTDGYSAHIGDIINFRAKAYLISDSPRGSYLNSSFIKYGTNVKYSEISKTGHENSFLGYLYELRENVTIKIEKSSLSRDTKGFLISLLLGDKTLLNKSQRISLNAAGMAHILAVSGLHVGIIYTVFYILLFPLSLLGRSKLRKIIALSLIWTYVLFTGCSPATIRAAIMATLIVMAYFLERKNASLNALLAAGFIILIIDPLNLWDIGFQLSFLCVASILLFPPKLNPIDHHLHPISYKIINMLLVTFFASFASWVLVALYYNSVPVMFLPANVLLLPLLPIFVSFAIIYLVHLLILGDNHILSFVLDKFYDFYFGAATWLSASSKGVIHINPHPMTVVLWVSGIIFLAISLYTNEKKKRIFHSSVGFISLSLSILLLIFVNTPVPSDIIVFPHSFTKMEARLNCKGEDLQLDFPRKRITEITHNQYYFLAVDNKLKPEILSSIKISDSKVSKYLLIGSNADMSQMAQLITSGDFSKIILHPGIGKNKKTDLIRQLHETYWEKIFPLAEIGSLSFNP